MFRRIKFKKNILVLHWLCNNVQAQAFFDPLMVLIEGSHILTTYFLIFWRCVMFKVTPVFKVSPFYGITKYEYAKKIANL